MKKDGPKIPLIKNDLFHTLAMPRGTVKLRAYVWLAKDDRVKVRLAFVDRAGDESDVLVMRTGPQAWRSVFLPALHLLCAQKLLAFDLREYEPSPSSDSVAPIT